MSARPDQADYTVSQEQLGDDSEIRTRDLRGVPATLVWVVGIAMTAFHVWALIFSPTDPWTLNSMHVLFATTLAFLIIPATRRSPMHTFTLWDWLLIAASIGVVVYLHTDLYRFTQRAGVFPTQADVIVGIVLLAVVIESTRRANGWSLPIMGGLFILYAVFGNYLPGLFYHRGYEVDRLVSFLFSDNGIYGTAVDTSAKYVFLFIVFGAFIEKSGIGEFLVNLGLSIAGRLRGGPAKVSIITSALFGTVSGSSAANVMVDGVINIPLMKATGFRSAIAGAIEAMNSTGGQIVPPVMGAAAFLMAEILGIPYSRVAVAAIIPALLYYVAAYWMIDFYAAGAGLHGLPRDRLPAFGATVLRKGYLLLPLVVLLYMIMGEGFSPFRAAWWALLVTVAVSYLSRATWLTPRRILDAMADGARRSIEIATTTAAAGIIIGVLALTGLGTKLSSILINMAGGNLFVVLVVTMVIAIILGLGLPTTAAYAIGASTLPPAITALGVPPLAAHMFLFYFAVISAITPPVAFASFAAASIAKAPMQETSWQSMRFGIAGYIVPFMFVYGPQLLMRGTWQEIAWAIATATVGTMALAGAAIGYFMGPLTWYARGAMLAASLLLIRPGLETDTIGFALLLAVGLLQRTMRRPAPAA